MTETTRPSARRQGTAAPSAQQPLPFDEPLPYDDEADEPIPFALTARARLAVAPDQVPPLTVVTGGRAPAHAPGSAPAADPGDLDEPGDTRPARARALRRAGLSVARIAAQLHADELAVRAWVDDVSPRRRPRSTPSRGGDAAARDDVEVVDAPGGPRRGVPDADRVAGRDPDGGAEEQRLAFELARATARDRLEGRLDADAHFAAGLGLAAGLCEIDAHAVTATATGLGIAGHLVAWLVDHLAVDRSRVRIVLRVGSAVAGDLVRHRWSGALGLPIDQIAHTRWRTAPTPDAVEALIRVADATTAATLAGWRDALLAPEDSGPADVAF